ncbi:hypothetical protein GGX14DRAFT_403148 [Mycena pura]|uniref:Uncharacterized protein n=1 Tax=Mycena pura TaxID=153505 RepID=A0AAD6Y1H2_9AGAR|nr:hypothetical protein GGX14DRAFT_403148 [Mycena pura]
MYQSLPPSVIKLPTYPWQSQHEWEAAQYAAAECTPICSHAILLVTPTSAASSAPIRRGAAGANRICRQLTIPPRTRTPQRCATGTGEQLGVRVRSGGEAAWAHLAGAIGDPRARFARFDARQAGGTTACGVTIGHTDLGSETWIWQCCNILPNSNPPRYGSGRERCAGVCGSAERPPSGDGVGAGGPQASAQRRSAGVARCGTWDPVQTDQGHYSSFFSRQLLLRRLLTEITFGVIDLVPVAPKH